jgi:poly(A) polymerase
LFRLSFFQHHLVVAVLGAAAAAPDLSDYDFARDLFRSWSDAEIAPAPLITGEDLIGMGLTPGPMFRSILTQVADEQLEGRLRERDEALRFVAAQYAGGKP